MVFLAAVKAALRLAAANNAMVRSPLVCVYIGIAFVRSRQNSHPLMWTGQTVPFFDEALWKNFGVHTYIGFGDTYDFTTTVHTYMFTGSVVPDDRSSGLIGTLI